MAKTVEEEYQEMPVSPIRVLSGKAPSKLDSMRDGSPQQEGIMDEGNAMESRKSIGSAGNDVLQLSSDKAVVSSHLQTEVSSAEKDIGNQFAFDMGDDVDEEETSAAVNDE